VSSRVRLANSREDFRPDWSPLRLWRRIGAIALLAFLPSFAGAAVAGQENLVFALFWGFPVLLGLSAWKIASFRCPGCGGKFQPSVMGIGRNCVQCGLKCYATRRDEFDPPEVPELAAKFQERRALWLRIGLPFFGLAFVGWLVAFALGLSGHERYIPWGGALMALGILGFVFSSMVLMRCPRCKKLPSTGRGISLDPERCPHCGLRLKP